MHSLAHGNNTTGQASFVVSSLSRLRELETLLFLYPFRDVNCGQMAWWKRISRYMAADQRALTKPRARAEIQWRGSQDDRWVVSRIANSYECRMNMHICLRCSRVRQPKLKFEMKYWRNEGEKNMNKRVKASARRVLAGNNLSIN